MIIAIRHFPDRKRPCIVLEDEQGCQALVLGYLTDTRREKWLRKAVMMEDTTGALSIRINSRYDLNEIMESEDEIC